MQRQTKEQGQSHSRTDHAEDQHQPQPHQWKIVGPPSILKKSLMRESPYRLTGFRCHPIRISLMRTSQACPFVKYRHASLTMFGLPGFCSRKEALLSASGPRFCSFRLRNLASDASDDLLRPSTPFAATLLAPVPVAPVPPRVTAEVTWFWPLVGLAGLCVADVSAVVGEDWEPERGL